MQIVVTELPYQMSCSAIAGRIQELVDAGDLDGIADVNDDSAGGKTSLVITLKRDANANVVLNNLFKLTQLQTSFSINMVALVDGVPRTLNLAQALHGYVDHQVEVVTRRTEFRLTSGPRTRAHILEGRIKALDVIDADHRPHPRQRRRRRRQGRPDGGAVRVLRDPGGRHPRHAAAPAHPAVADRPRDRARRRAGDASASSRRSSPTRCCCAASSRTSCARPAREVRHAAGVPDHARLRRDVDRGPRRRQGARRRDDRGAVRQVGAGRRSSRPRPAAAAASPGPSSRPTTSSAT